MGITSIISGALSLLNKVFLPIMIYLKGKQTERMETKIEALEKENEGLKDAKELEEDVDNMSRDELIDSLRK
jgi:hypothetical protein